MTYSDTLKLTLDQLGEIKATLNSNGWKTINKYFQDTLDYHINVIKKEKDIDKLFYSQGVIEILEGFYNEIKMVDVKTKSTINLIKNYKRRN